jgi:hypothetical protein
MLKTKKLNVIDDSDWDDLVSKTYGRSYSPEDRDLFFGILQESGSAGELKPVARFGQISTIHSGAFTPGQLVYIGDDLILTNEPSSYEIGIAVTEDNVLIRE